MCTNRFSYTHIFVHKINKMLNIRLHLLTTVNTLLKEMLSHICDTNNTVDERCFVSVSYILYGQISVVARNMIFYCSLVLVMSSTNQKYSTFVLFIAPPNF